MEVLKDQADASECAIYYSKKKLIRHIVLCMAVVLFFIISPLIMYMNDEEKPKRFFVLCVISLIYLGWAAGSFIKYKNINQPVFKMSTRGICIIKKGKEIWLNNKDITFNKYQTTTVNSILSIQTIIIKTDKKAYKISAISLDLTYKEYAALCYKYQINSLS
ncbi:hypothetical protein ACI6Q2_15685 [Chitinophagaceae bacterium LWZ2-11]